MAVVGCPVVRTVLVPALIDGWSEGRARFLECDELGQIPERPGEAGHGRHCESSRVELQDGGVVVNEGLAALALSENGPYWTFLSEPWRIPPQDRICHPSVQRPREAAREGQRRSLRDRTGAPREAHLTSH